MWFIDLFCVFTDDGVRVMWAHREGSNFQLVRRPQLSFRAFSSRSSLTKTFVESCVHSKVAHSSILMVQREL